MSKIKEIEVKKNKDGSYKSMRTTFGPHYFVDIYEDGGKVTFVLGVTHHGFKADASEVGGELEKFIDEIKSKHPKNVVD